MSNVCPSVCLSINLSFYLHAYIHICMYVPLFTVQHFMFQFRVSYTLWTMSLCHSQLPKAKLSHAHVCMCNSLILGNIYLRHVFPTTLQDSHYLPLGLDRFTAKGWVIVFYTRVHDKEERESILRTLFTTMQTCWVKCLAINYPSILLLYIQLILDIFAQWWRE